MTIWAGRSCRGFLMIGVLSPLMAACAHQDEHAMSTQWSFDGSEYSEYIEQADTAATPGHGSLSSGDAAQADKPTDRKNWSERTYVYRGGRDPKTGVAYKQM